MFADSNSSYVNVYVFFSPFKLLICQVFIFIFQAYRIIWVPIEDNEFQDHNAD